MIKNDFLLALPSLLSTSKKISKPINHDSVPRLIYAASTRIQLFYCEQYFHSPYFPQMLKGYQSEGCSQILFSFLINSSHVA